MTFDEQLRRAFDAVTDRLRDETSRQLQAVAGELASAAGADLERAAVEARETAERDAAARLAAADGTIETAVTAARIDCRSAEFAASQRLVSAVRAIEEAQSLSEILDTLVS